MTVCHPATRHRWNDLATLFGTRGACGGCWCMWYRLPRRTYEATKGAKNRARFRRLVWREAPGVLAYRHDEAVGWCSIAPREEFVRLKTSRIVQPLDGNNVWSITCLFVRSDARRQGVSVQLIRAASGYALEKGAAVVEAYPIVPARSDVPAVFAATGTLSAFLRAGFAVASRPSATRAIVRLTPGRAPAE